MKIGIAVAELLVRFTSGVDYSTAEGKKFIVDIAALMGERVAGGGEAVKSVSVGERGFGYKLNALKFRGSPSAKECAFLAAKQAESLYLLSGLESRADVSGFFNAWLEKSKKAETVTA